MRRIKRFLVTVLVLIVVVYLVGPKPDNPEFNKDLPSFSSNPGILENFVIRKNGELPIKEDNESRIIWFNDTVKSRTNHSILYLHGFSASWYEGFPSHVEFARTFGCNLYIPLLASHGLETAEPMLDLTPDLLYESAKEALMIARSIGKKVIIMGTSTGGTLALKLASDFPEYVDGLVLYSPNVKINNRAAWLLTKPWGLQIGRKVNGGKYRIFDDAPDSKDCRFWYCKYRMEATVALQKLVESTMNRKTFRNITAPVFLGYYYKDKNNQDQTVQVGAMLKMFDQLGTLDGKKVKVAFPDAGDHVIGCEHTSGCIDEVITESIQYGMNVLGLMPVVVRD